MKKISYIILGIVIGALGTYFYCKKDVQVEKTAVAIVKPSDVITPAQAKILNDNWTREREAVNDSAAKKYGQNKDNRWTWWSLDDVKNYLNYAENEADSLGYDMNGIRVYLGVYGPNEGQAKKNLTTMFVVPTGKKSHSEASVLNFMVQGDNNNIPGGSVLNRGGGGSSSYNDD